MENQPFEKLAEQAASGLKGDPELFLDVKQELHSHLEDKAELFAGEGKSEEESVELSCKSLGSPMDMAAELLNGNKQRMKRRSLMRLFLGGLIVPVAVVLALGVGLWRYVNISKLAPEALYTDYADDYSPVVDDDPNSLIHKLKARNENAPQIRKYWETHRSDQDSRTYYAYYAIFLEPTNKASFVDAMHLGEKIEPENALYNVLLAQYYLKRGVQSKTDPPSYSKTNKVAFDKIFDRNALELGKNEVIKAVTKRYLYTYQAQIMQKKLDSLPSPILTEDYIRDVNVIADESYSSLLAFNDISRRIPVAVRLLIADGRRTDAIALMDTWKPYTRLLTSESSPIFTYCLITNSTGILLSKDAVSTYKKLGVPAKAAEARIIRSRLTQLRDRWIDRNAPTYRKTKKQLREHGTFLTSIFIPVIGDIELTDDELKPGRMHEYVVAEECVTQILLIILALSLIGTLIQSVLWLYKLQQAASVPILLLPPTKLMLRVLILGIVLPVMFYWFYTRVLPIGGRDYSLGSGMWLRFLIEMGVMALLMLLIPTVAVRRYIRRRCADFNIAVPSEREEVIATWIVRVAMTIAISLVVIVCNYWTNMSLLLSLLGVVFAFVIIVMGIRYIVRKRNQHGLYYGTLAKSLVPVYALSIVLISVTLQPLLMRSEVDWLNKDALFFKHPSDTSSAPVGFTRVEQKASQRYWSLLRQALSDGPGSSN